MKNEENKQSWKTIHEGFKNLMSKNDSLPIADLKIKSKRLKHLSDFVLTLQKRVNERIQGVGVGPIDPLFEVYHEARTKIDETAI